MCAVSDDIMRMFTRHAYYPGKHHRYWVRLARQMYEHHRRDCPDCRGGYDRTNYNARPPRRITYRMGREP